MKKKCRFICVLIIFLLNACQVKNKTPDNIVDLPIDLDGSLQNPAWSPDGKQIVFTRFRVWIMDTDDTNHHQLTSGCGNKTDASYSPDGQWIVFSADNPEIKYSELFIQSIFDSQAIQLTNYGNYVGAPSWSPDGNLLIFEVSENDPNKNSGTKLWILDNLPTGE